MPVNATNEKFGWLAPDFNLLDVSGKKLSLNEITGSNGTVIAFICNHCPYVIAIAERLSKEAKELSKLSINTIAIMSNDVTQYPDDSYENMKLFAKITILSFLIFLMSHKMWQKNMALFAPLIFLDLIVKICCVIEGE